MGQPRNCLPARINAERSPAAKPPYRAMTVRATKTNLKYAGNPKRVTAGGLVGALTA